MGKARKHVTQRAAAVLAMAVARVMGIKVSFVRNNLAATDGETIYLPTLPALMDERVGEMLKGLAVHEGGHVLFTDFKRKRVDALTKGLANVIEDIRMERLCQKKFPGAAKMLHATVQACMDKDIGWFRGPEADDHPATVLNMALLYRLRLEELGQSSLADFAADYDVVARNGFGDELWDKIFDIALNGSRGESSHDTQAAAEAIIKLLKDEQKVMEKKVQQQQKKDQQQKGESSEDGEPQAGGEGQAEGEPQDGGEEQSESSEGGTSSKGKEESDEDESGSGGDGEDAEDETSDEDESEGSGGKANDESEEESDTGTGNGEGEDESDEESEGDADGDGDESEGEDESEEGESDADGDGDQDDDAGDEAGDQGDSSGDNADSSATSAGHEGGEMPEGADQQAGSGASIGDPDELEQLLEALKEALGADEGDIRESDLSALLQTLSGEGVSVVNPIRQPLPPPYVSSQLERVIRNRLGGHLEALLVAETECKRRPSEHGRLHTRRIAKAMVDNPVIFRHKQQGEGLDTAVFILGDSSSSMSEHGHASIQRDAIRAIVRTLEQNEIPTAIGTFDNAMRWIKDFDETVDYRRIPSIATGGTNMPGGLYWATGELIKRDERRRVLVLLSDGLSNLEESAAIVSEANRLGIETAPVFIGAQIAEAYKASPQVRAFCDAFPIPPRFALVGDEIPVKLTEALTEALNLRGI